jgi:hypothetical protein
MPPFRIGCNREIGSQFVSSCRQWRSDGRAGHPGHLNGQLVAQRPGLESADAGTNEEFRGSTRPSGYPRDAARFCDDFRMQHASCDLPDEIILKSLMNERKAVNQKK